MRLSLERGSLDYEISGDGPGPLVFIPALGMAGGMWQGQVERFHTEYTLITYDAAHLGSGYVPREASLRSFADELGHLLDAVGAVSAHIVGLSMGGMIAQVFAFTYPERVKSLVLASTTASYPEENRRQLRDRARTAEDQGLKPLLDPTMERWFTPSFRERHPDVVERVRTMLASADPGAYAAAARAAAAVDTVSDLSGIQATTLVLRGEHDASVSRDAAHRLATEIPRARSAELKGAAHLCNMENPDAFNGELSAFLTAAAADSLDETGLHAPVGPW